MSAFESELEIFGSSLAAAERALGGHLCSASPATPQAVTTARSAAPDSAGSHSALHLPAVHQSCSTDVDALMLEALLGPSLVPTPPVQLAVGASLSEFASVAQHGSMMHVFGSSELARTRHSGAVATPAGVGSRSAASGRAPAQLDSFATPGNGSGPASTALDAQRHLSQPWLEVLLAVLPSGRE